jgi:hypothetical protein
MATFINFTRYQTTPAQKAAGILDIPDNYYEALVELLLFEISPIPTQIDLQERAMQVVSLYEQYIEENKHALDQLSQPVIPMIGGAPFFLGTLEVEFISCGYNCAYPITKREKIEQVGPSNIVRKQAVFSHLGMVVIYADTEIGSELQELVPTDGAAVIDESLGMVEIIDEVGPVPTEEQVEEIRQELSLTASA